MAMEERKDNCRTQATKAEGGLRWGPEEGGSSTLLREKRVGGYLRQ